MLTRRTLLRALGGAALTPALGGCRSVNSPQAAAQRSSSASPAVRPGRLPMSVLNETGRFANRSVWMYVVGSDLETGAQGYVGPDGVLTPCSTADNGPDGFADFAMPLAATGATRVELPYMSGRVYFSLGEKLKFRVLPGSKLQYPAPWSTSDPSVSVLHDCMEFTHNVDGMFCNTTMVDMFSVPMSISLAGALTQTTGTLTDGGRRRIFERVAAQPGYERLVVGDIRVLAPSHGLDAGLFADDYFEPAIEQVWRRYARTELRVTTARGVFAGKVRGDTLTFDKGVRPIARPSTRDVLFCDGALAAPNDGVTGPVAAVLGAGFNRSVLQGEAQQPVLDEPKFYRGAVTNHYARAMHESSIDRKAYGFAFDDVGGKASYVEDRAPLSLTVRLTAFDSRG